MEHHNLSTNSFDGEVPAAVAWLLELKSLLLDTNQFTGMYPAAEISRLTGLEVLTLADNAFLPASVSLEFAKLTKLTYLELHMSINQLTREITVSFGNFKNLELLFF